jgi:predicted O-methyltransferase YrrM
MNLNDALRQIAADGGLDADELIAYANEDAIGGRDTGAWDSMSTFADEGRIIYALVRALKPYRVIEIGVASGGTSTHILTALENNGNGELHSFDIEANCGINVPEHLRHRWTFTVGDALTTDYPDADFVFEDGAHTLEFGQAIYPRLKALSPRIIVAHDYYTHETYGGFHVKEAFDAVLPDGLGVKVDGAFTGLGVWFNREWEAPIAFAEPVEETAPVVKKAPAKKKAAKRG